MPAKKENNFEKKLARLEEIVDTLENKDAPLEETAVLFEEGVKLSAELSAKLKEIKFKVEKLKKDAKLALEPFEE